MAQINVSAVMVAIAARALSQGIVLRAYDWPVETIQPPCLVAGYPTQIDFDYTFGRASDRATFPFWIICGKVSERTTRDILSAYIAGVTGIKDAIDGTLNGSCQTARVVDCKIEEITVAGIAYLAAAFTVDVIS